MEFSKHNFHLNIWVSYEVGQRYQAEVDRRWANMTPKTLRQLKKLKADVIDEILRKHYKLGA